MNESASTPTTPRPDGTPRRKLRMATIGGIAAIAILGGGITAVASAEQPASGTASASDTANTSTVLPTAGSTGAAAPTGKAAPTGTATRPTPKPHLDGTVTSVSGSTVLIKDREGFTRTIVLSSKTAYTDGLKAALATGTKIHAEGTVDANGTSLDATTVGADKGPMGGPGRGDGPMGGRGPRGDHGTPPAGAPGGWGPGAPSGTGTKAPAPSSAPSTSSASPTTS